MRITRDIFTIFRNPIKQSAFCGEVYTFIKDNKELRHTARLRPEPFKTFIEEFMPFTFFCEWKYGDATNVECALVEGTPGRDGIVRNVETGLEHSVEITCPIDGLEVMREAKQLNERGYTDLKIWALGNTSMHQGVVKRTLKIAEKKALRNYHSPGGSTLIFVFDSDLFRPSNQQHISIMTTLLEQLRNISFLCDDVLLILSPQRKIMVVKTT